MLIVLGAALARAGSHDEAAATLDAAAHAPATVGAPGRLSTIRQVALLIPPGPHRAHLDDTLRG